MGRCKSLGPLKSFLSHASQLSGVSSLRFHMLSFLSAHRREVGATSRLPYCRHCSSQVPSEFQKFAFGGLELLMAVTALFTDMAGNTHLFSLTTKETPEKENSTGFTRVQVSWLPPWPGQRWGGGRSSTPTHLPGRGH